MLHIPNLEKPLLKRTLADVKFQMAEQDNLVDDTQEADVVNMLNLSGNTDLIKGVYEGGFKTWECSIDMVQYLSGLPEEQITNKRVLEVGMEERADGNFMQTSHLLCHSLVAVHLCHHCTYYPTATPIESTSKITTTKSSASSLYQTSF